MEENKKMPATIRVNSRNSDYSIKIQHGLIERLGIEILRLNDDIENEILLITDEKVSELYLQQVIINFQECPKPEGTRMRICEILIESGENAKNFNTVSKLLEGMAELGLSKKCCVVALGGGVVCDAAGWAAGCYMGGVKLILVPTTLAAMINSSVGGSAFLNLNAGKNLAGMSCSPSLVLCDTDCLKTLNSEEYKSGLAETFKISLMAGGELFRIFERGEVSNSIEKLIEGCIKFRAGLNIAINSKCIGCELGNAIESLSAYGIKHGYALCEGLQIILNVSYKKEFCSEKTFNRIINAMKKNNLFVKGRSFKSESIAQAILNGRKFTGSEFELAFISEIGKYETKKIKTSELESIISLGMS